LDWIVMKALEKDRNRRYETASGLAADVRRYLEDEPVQACPPSVGYRLRKFARRNKPILATGGLVALTLVVGTMVSTLQAIRATQAERKTAAALAEARQQRAEAGRKSAEAQAVVDYLITDMIGAASPERTRGRTTTVEEALAGADRVIDGRFPGQPLTEAAIRHAMGIAYGSLRWPDKAEQHLTKAVEVRTRHLGPEHPDTLDSMICLAVQKYSSGHGDDALVLSQHVLNARRRTLGADHPLTLAAETSLAYNLGGLSRYEEAQAVFERACAGRARVLGPEARETLEAMAGLARLLYTRGNLDEAEALSRRTVDGFRRLGDEHYPRALHAIGGLADVLIRQGKLVEAEALCNKLLEGWDQLYGPDNWDSCGTIQSWMNVLLLQGRLDEIRVLFNRRLAKLDASPVGTDPRQRERRAFFLNWIVRWLITNAETASIDPAARVRAAEKAVELNPRASGIWETLSVAYYRADAWDKSLAAQAKCKSLEPDRYVAASDFVSAMAHWQRGEKDMAMECFDRARAWMQKNRPGDQDLIRLRAEATALMRVNSPRGPNGPRGAFRSDSRPR
jgi:tetratricopeptide (TPR) repeat protein